MAWKKYIFAVTLIILGILFRTIFHLGDNVEFVTTATLLASSYLGWRFALIVPLLIMVVSDLVIGNTLIFIFTWSAYIIIGLIGYWGFKYKKLNIKYKKYHLQTKILYVIKATTLGIIASFWFFLWTNFGVWLLDSWGMYSDNLKGLVDAYILGLPFLKLNLLGNLFFVPTSFFLIEFVISAKVFHKFSLNIFQIAKK